MQRRARLRVDEDVGLGRRRHGDHLEVVADDVIEAVDVDPGVAHDPERGQHGGVEGEDQEGAQAQGEVHQPL